MNVAKPLTPFEIEPEGDDQLLDVEIVDLEPSDDGSVVVTLDSGEVIDSTSESQRHDEDVSLLMKEQDLDSLASDLISRVMSDRMSRHEWAETYVKGLDLLGLKIEKRTDPWPGASGVFHPILGEAVISFQAQAMGEIMPASGPAKTKINGTASPERTKRAQRVQHEMNRLITEEMTDFRPDTEQMLFRLPLAGSSFKKVYYDPIRKKPRSVMVPAEDLIISYGASSLADSPRYTHWMRKDPDELRRLQVSGFYRDIDIPAPAFEQTDIEAKYDEINGASSQDQRNTQHTILEVHADLVLDEPKKDENGLALPYVVSIEKTSMKVLSIRRNWYEDDETRSKRLHFSHYYYLPGLGFYGFGLTHILGGLAKSSTSILRQLIDAGTLSNLPAGLKTRGLRMKDDKVPLKPGEFRDVDVPGQSIRDNIYMLPYKEPSTVLYQLLGDIVEQARRMASVADIRIGEIGAQAPVGTTLALMERTLKVMTGVQARLHASQHVELTLIAGIVRDFMAPEYPYEVDGDFTRAEDFSDKIEIVPVSDPNAATMAQRIMQYQAALQLSTQAPQLYNQGLLHRQMLEVLGIKDAGNIVKLPEDLKPMDPISENMAILKQDPVRAFLHQDHESHIAVHMAAAQDPKLQQIVGQSPFASAIQSAMAAHITEHVAMQYRVEMERIMGVSLPPPEENLPDDVEVELSRLVAMAAGKLLERNTAEVAKQEAEEAANDPLTKIQLEELEIEKQKVKDKKEIEFAKLQLAAKTQMENINVQRERIKSEDRRAGAQIGVRVASQIEDAKHKDKAEGMRLGIEVAKELSRSEIERERIEAMGRNFGNGGNQ